MYYSTGAAQLNESSKLNKSRKILHVDINNCYASIECVLNPSLTGKPIAVAGDPQERHGIILAKNMPAKACGVQTGEAIWQAKAKCPELILLKPHYQTYLQFSKRAQEIYGSYCDRVEPFGIDECWMDVSGSREDEEVLANEIRCRIKKELGITVSVGASFNKIFAKLGSDMKKPDAVTVIKKNDFKSKVWGLSASELLFVGKATQKALLKYGIRTIGDIAVTPPENLRSWFGLNGLKLWRYANGLDDSPVRYAGESATVKSIGNSMTAYRDLVSIGDVKLAVLTLSESVAMRLRDARLKACGISIAVRDKYLQTFSRQCKSVMPTDDALQISHMAMELFSMFRSSQLSNSFENGQSPIRSIGVSAYNLIPADSPIQLDIFTPAEKLEKLDRLNRSIDMIRKRYGYAGIRRASVMTDESFAGFDVRLQNEIHPTGFTSQG